MCIHFWRFFWVFIRTKNSLWNTSLDPRVNVDMYIVLLQCLFTNHHINWFIAATTVCLKEQKLKKKYLKVPQAISTGFCLYHESYFKYRSMWWDDKIRIFKSSYRSLCSPAPNSWTARNTGPSRRRTRKGVQMSRDCALKVHCVNCGLIYNIYLNIHENKNKSNLVFSHSDWFSYTKQYT